MRLNEIVLVYKSHNMGVVFSEHWNDQGEGVYGVWGIGNRKPGNN